MFGQKNIIYSFHWPEDRKYWGYLCFGQYKFVHLDGVDLIFLKFYLYQWKKCNFRSVHSSDLIFGHGHDSYEDFFLLKTEVKSKVQTLKNYDVGYDLFWLCFVNYPDIFYLFIICNHFVETFKFCKFLPKSLIYKGLSCIKLHHNFVYFTRLNIFYSFSAAKTVKIPEETFPYVFISKTKRMNTCNSVQLKIYSIVFNLANNGIFSLKDSFKNPMRRGEPSHQLAVSINGKDEITNRALFSE